jgi:hypothetical protein
MSLCQFAGTMCAWCAPTPRVMVVVPPTVSFGGALLVPPWHALQAWFAVTSTLPSMWRVGSVNVVAPVMSSWHEPQLLFCG